MSKRTKGIKIGNTPKGEDTEKVIDLITKDTQNKPVVKKVKSTRIKFTTALENKYIIALKIKAAKEGKKVADIIEDSLTIHLDL